MNTHDIKVAADGAAVTLGVAGFMQWLPPAVGVISGLLTIVWLGIRIWESDTVQGLRSKDAKSI